MDDYQIPWALAIAAKTDEDAFRAILERMEPQVAQMQRKWFLPRPLDRDDVRQLLYLSIWETIRSLPTTPPVGLRGVDHWLVRHMNFSMVTALRTATRQRRTPPGTVLSLDYGPPTTPETRHALHERVTDWMIEGVDLPDPLDSSSDMLSWLRMYVTDHEWESLWAPAGDKSSDNARQRVRRKFARIYATMPAALPEEFQAAIRHREIRTRRRATPG